MDILSEVVRNLYTQYGPSSIADGNTVMQTFLKQAPNAQQEAASLDAFLRAGGNHELLKVQGCYDPVEYARSHGTEVKPEEIGHTWWWLRTPGMEASRVCNVVSKGTASTYGAEFFHNQGTIRPVMWIQLG